MTSRLPAHQQDRIPLNSRDDCDIHLYPLNECRRDTFYLPWKCTHLRNTYEKCSSDLYFSYNSFQAYFARYTMHVEEGRRLAQERKAKGLTFPYGDGQ
jgi:hypothetical protein